MKSILLFLLSFLLIASPFSVADIDSLSQAINEAGRLRMLSQRMAKAHLLLGMEVSPEKSKNQLFSARSRFEKNLNDLSKFNRTATQKQAVSEIETAWREYKSLLDETPNIGSYFSILNASDRTLKACEKLVQELEKTASRSSARLVNLSGRQRMLSQRIAKLYTAISWSGDVIRIREMLETTIEEFEVALTELKRAPENTTEVQQKLAKVETQWNFSKAGFRVLGQGKSTPLIIAMTTEKILNQMNEITALYEFIDKSQMKNLTTN